MLVRSRVEDKKKEHAIAQCSHPALQDGEREDQERGYVHVEDALRPSRSRCVKFVQSMTLTTTTRGWKGIW